MLTLESRERMRQGALHANEVVRKRFRQKYEENPSYCNYCKTKLVYEKRGYKFCNHSCSAKQNNLNNCRNPRRHEVKPCLACGKDTFNKKFCEIKCQAEYYWKLRVEKLEATGRANTGIIKRYLIEKYDHKCMICGITEWMGQQVLLILDHIDGDATNNHVSNFRLVCSNCDAQLPTYKSKNKNCTRGPRKYY